MRNLIHYPKLDTILKVEKIIKNSKEPLSKNEVDRRLKTQIMRPTLNLILQYLEQSGKIAILKDGIIWIYSEDISNKLKAKLSKGITVKSTPSKEDLIKNLGIFAKNAKKKLQSKGITEDDLHAK